MPVCQGSEKPEKAQTVAKSGGWDLVRYDQNLHLIQQLRGSADRQKREKLSSCCTPRFMGRRFNLRTSAAVGLQGTLKIASERNAQR